MKIIDFESRPAGYSYLMKKFELSGFPNWHTSFVSTTGTHYSSGRKRSSHFDFLTDQELTAMENVIIFSKNNKNDMFNC